jgi:hypothetical protein
MCIGKYHPAMVSFDNQAFRDFRLSPLTSDLINASTLQRFNYPSQPYLSLFAR